MGYIENRCACSQCNVLSPSSAEMIAVAPASQLEWWWLANAHQFESLTQLCESNIVGGDAQSRGSKFTLCFFHGLPARFNWGEIPARTFATHDPQPAFRGIESKASANLKVLESFVSAES